MRSCGPRVVDFPFDFGGIVFARTDARGVIRAGNPVFHGVSGHAWSRRVGGPHKLVRHPETPKAAFHWLREGIKAGLATGAHICNCSEDGRFQWVFAVVVPLADGHLSVRIEPGTELLGKVGAIHAGLRPASGRRHEAPGERAGAGREDCRDRVP